MKEIVVKESNKARIEEAIREAEGRATARTIDFDDIVEDIGILERKLHIPKKSMEGVEIWIDHHAQTFPNAYKYVPESTNILLRRTSSGWKLCDVARKVCHTPGRHFILTLTEEAKRAILESFAFMDEYRW